MMYFFSLSDYRNRVCEMLFCLFCYRVLCLHIRALIVKFQTHFSGMKVSNRVFCLFAAIQHAFHFAAFFYDDGRLP